MAKMTNKERMAKRLERQQYWNNVLGEIAEMQDWCDEALSYTPSCLQKTKKSKEEKKEDFNKFVEEVTDNTKEVMETLVKTFDEILKDFNVTKEQKEESNIVDVDPETVTEVAVVEENNATEEKKAETVKESKEEVAATEELKEAKVVEEKPAESTTETKPKKKEEEVVDLEFTVREPGVELPIPHTPHDDMIKTLPNGDVVDTAFTVRDEEPKKEEPAKPEVYEFDPVRAQTELMAINKLEQARMTFDHFNRWVNHSQCIDILRDGTRDLIVAWAASQGYAMFDTTAPIYGPEMAPYRERLEFLLSKRVISDAEFAVLERRASHVMRWDYNSMLDEYKLTEAVYNKYFRSVYPWSVDAAKFEQARAKASEANLAYLKSLKK